MRKRNFHGTNNKRTVCLIAVFICFFRSRANLDIRFIFDKRREIGEKQIDKKFLENGGGSGTGKFFSSQAGFEFFVLGFNGPAKKIEFFEQGARNLRVKDIGCKIFFRTVIQSNLNDPDWNITNIVFWFTGKAVKGITGTVLGKVIAFLEPHNTQKTLFHTVTEHAFGLAKEWGGKRA